MKILRYQDLDEEIENKLMSDPVYFSEKMLGLRLHWYQKIVIRDQYPLKTLCWSRQIGKSTMVAAYVVWYIFTNEDKNILIISQDRQSSKRFYNTVISFILRNEILASSIDGEALQSTTKFTNGVVMQNKAPGKKGTSARGDSVDLLILDEADFIEEEVFVAVEQTTASKHGSIILISTPNRKGTTFYQYYQDGLKAHRKSKGEIELEESDYEYMEDDEDVGYDHNDPKKWYIGHPPGRIFGFKSYHFDYTVGLDVQVILKDGTKRPQLSKATVRRLKRKSTYWKFQQEYEAIWAEDIASYFSSEQIINATDESYDMITYGLPNRTYYLGIDFAKHVDKTVALVGEMQDDGRLKVVYIYSVHGRNWVKQKNDIVDIANRFNIRKAYLDGTGVGDNMFDELNGVNSPLYKKCERIVFTLPTKNNIYQNLSNLFNVGKIIIPHHKQLIDELMFLQYEKTSGGYVKIHEPKGMTNIGDDFADAMALLALSMTKNLLIGEFNGYLIRKNLSPYPNFWKENNGVGNKKLPFWDTKPGVKIYKTTPTNNSYLFKNKRFHRSRYVHRWN